MARSDPQNSGNADVNLGSRCPVRLKKIWTMEQHVNLGLKVERYDGYIEHDQRHKMDKVRVAETHERRRHLTLKTAMVLILALTFQSSRN
jgi:hypothetical protein